MDNIVRTVKGDPEKMLHAANKLNLYQQFTLQKANERGNLAFLDFYVNVDSRQT